MQRPIRAILFSLDPQTGTAIRNSIQNVGSIRLVREVSTVDDVIRNVQRSQTSLVIVALDPDLDASMQAVRELSHGSPGVGIIGVSERQDPQAIIEAMRAGCTQFVIAPIEDADLINAVHRVRSASMEPEHSSKRICLVGATGGVGVTTISCNLAMELAQLAHRPIALVDLNLEYGDVACAFDCHPKFSIADLCKEGHEIDESSVAAAIHELPCQVHLLPRPASVQDVYEIVPENVEHVLSILGTLYPHVVIDLPRGYNFFSAVSVHQADLILIVMELNVTSVRNAQRIHDTLLEMHAPVEALQIVINRAKAEHARVSIEDIENQFGRPVFASIPNDYRRVQTSRDFGHPILADAPNSPARLAIHELAKKICFESHALESNAKGKGLFGRLWSKSSVGS